MANSTTTKPPFQFPQFNMPGFPYASLPDQLAASFVPPNQQFTNGSQYGRWNGINNNAFGLFPNQFGPLFGYQPGGQMPFMPPWANNGNLGSNQGPGANPGMSPPPSTTPPPPSSGSGQPPSMGGMPSPPPFQVGTPPSPTGSFPPFNIPPPQGSNPSFTTAPSGLPAFGQSPGSNTTPMPGSNVTPFPSNGLSMQPLASINKMAPSGLLSGSNQAFSSNFMPNASGGPGSLGAEELAYIQRNPNSQRAQYYNSLPQSFTPAQFNQVAQQNPVLAEQMAGQMGQAGRNAIMANNGLSNEQFNQFLNANGSGALPGFGPQQIAYLNSLGIR